MLSICLPTRGRPERFSEMYRSALETAHGEVEVVAVMDDDDETRFDYPSGPTYLTLPVGTMKQSGMWSHAFAHAKGDIAHLGADDLVYRTPGWDVRVAAAFERWRDRIGMVYCNDGYALSPKPFKGQKPSDAIDGKYVFAANPFCSREWIEALDGFFTPPFYDSWEADTWIYQVADAISRAAYLGDVLIEHLHPMAGKAEMDDTYRRGAAGNERMKRQGWALTRSPRMRKLRAEQARKLTEAIQARRKVPA